MSKCVLAAATIALLCPRPAVAGWWDSSGAVTTDEIPTLRIVPTIGFWVATFNRPASACNTFPTTIREQSFGCAGASSEIAFSGGTGILIHAWGPLHLAAALELVYTFPERDFLIKNQVLLTLPVSLVLTMREWRFRPILAATLLPLLYITDDSRDYAVGGEAGFAWRVPQLAEVSLTAAYHKSDTVESVITRLAIYLP